MFSFNGNNNSPYKPGNPKETELYDLLELKPDATEEEIKKQYKIVAKKVHPDKNPNNIEEATRKFQKVNDAFKILSDPQKRQIYDMEGKRGLEGINGSDAGGGNEDPFGMFQNIFGGNFPFNNFSYMYKKSKRDNAITFLF